MNELKKLLESYQVTIAPVAEEDGGGFKANYKELALSVSGYGTTQAEALADLEDLALDGLADEDLSEFPAPLGEAPWADYSGRVTLRMPKMLHAKVDRQAQEQGVSLNQWMCHILESATTAVGAGCEFGARTEGGTTLFEEVAAMRELMDGWSMMSSRERSYGELQPAEARRSKGLSYEVPLELVRCA